MNQKSSDCPSVTIAQIKTDLARIYGTSERQVARWIGRKAPVLVASRLRGHLAGQNNGGAASDRLTRPGETERIQRELDALFGEDLATSAMVLDHAVELDDLQHLLHRAVKDGKLRQKREWLQVAKQINKAIRAADDLTLIPPAIETPYRETEGSPEDVVDKVQ